MILRRGRKLWIQCMCIPCDQIVWIAAGFSITVIIPSQVKSVIRALQDKFEHLDELLGNLLQIAEEDP